MIFLICTHVTHKFYENKYFAYSPYIKEMNLWLKNVEEVIIVAPIKNEKPNVIESPIISNNIKFLPLKEFNILNIKEVSFALLYFPYNFYKIWKGMILADHIHIRCPGNIGLLSSICQILFPFKKKTVKYAGNWDLESKQPWSYKLQKFITSNSLISKNIKVLIYGEWKSKSKNLLPFFTASYSNKDKVNFEKPDINKKVRLIFVGTLSPGKNPIDSITLLNLIRKEGIHADLYFCGDGILKEKLKEYIDKLDLNNSAFIMGNMSQSELVEYYIKSHFLVFLSDSEGWPKVVAEAMWWGCIPVVKPISCLPNMLDFGKRGIIHKDNFIDTLNQIINYIKKPHEFNQISILASNWARNFTVEKFEQEIKKLL